MLNRISDTFSLNHQDLVEAGVLDSFIDVDSRFHIDPYLLSSIEIPELSDCYEKLRVAKFLKSFRCAMVGADEATT